MLLIQQLLIDRLLTVHAGRGLCSLNLAKILKLANEGLVLECLEELIWAHLVVLVTQ